jgi:hypothetical protein
VNEITGTNCSTSTFCCFSSRMTVHVVAKHLGERIHDLVRLVSLRGTERNPS